MQQASKDTWKGLKVGICYTCATVHIHTSHHTVVRDTPHTDLCHAQGTLTPQSSSEGPAVHQRAPRRDQSLGPGQYANNQDSPSWPEIHRARGVIQFSESQHFKLCFSFVQGQKIAYLAPLKVNDLNTPCDRAP